MKMVISPIEKVLSSMEKLRSVSDAGTRNHIGLPSFRARGAMRDVFTAGNA